MRASDPPEPTAPPDPAPRAGDSPLMTAGKAVGCAVLALLVLAIALVVGVFDLLF